MPVPATRPRTDPKARGRQLLREGPDEVLPSGEEERPGVAVRLPLLRAGGGAVRLAFEPVGQVAVPRLEVLRNRERSERLKLMAEVDRVLGP